MNPFKEIIEEAKNKAKAQFGEGHYTQTPFWKFILQVEKHFHDNELDKKDYREKIVDLQIDNNRMMRHIAHRHLVDVVQEEIKNEEISNKRNCDLFICESDALYAFMNECQLEDGEDIHTAFERWLFRPIAKAHTL